MKLTRRERKGINFWLQLKPGAKEYDCPFRAVGYVPKRRVIRGSHTRLSDISVEMRMPQCTRICRKVFPKLKEKEREIKYLPCPCTIYSMDEVIQVAESLLTTGE